MTKFAFSLLVFRKIRLFVRYK